MKKPADPVDRLLRALAVCLFLLGAMLWVLLLAFASPEAADNWPQP